MATIKIPTPLRQYTGGTAKIDVKGETVGAAMDHLMEQYPDLKPHLYEDGKLRAFVNVFLGDEDVRFLDGVETEIDPDDSLRIIPSIAGGN